MSAKVRGQPCIESFRPFPLQPHHTMRILPLHMLVLMREHQCSVLEFFRPFRLAALWLQVLSDVSSGHKVLQQKLTFLTWKHKCNVYCIVLGKVFVFLGG